MSSTTRPVNKLTALLFLLLAVTGTATPVWSADEDAYRLQPGDLLFISVWKETDLQVEVLVRPDGGLSFPLAGEQVAAGRTVEQLRIAIDEKLRKYMPDPVVTVAVRQIGGNRIYVVGKVNRPGEFPFSRSIDVMQSLGLAGGATPFAALNDIRILRRENGKQSSIPFRYDDVAKGRNLGQNVLLRSATCSPSRRDSR